MESFFKWDSYSLLVGSSYCIVTQFDTSKLSIYLPSLYKQCFDAWAEVNAKTPSSRGYLGFSALIRGAFHSTKIRVWNFGNFTWLMGRYIPVGTDPTQATARFVIVASHHNHNYALKEKSKYCLYPKEHSTVEKGRWKTKGGGILFRVESLWMQVKVKNSCELKRYVSQNIRTIRSNSWNCTVNKFGVLANLYSARLCCIHFSLIDKLL